VLVLKRIAGESIHIGEANPDGSINEQTAAVITILPPDSGDESVRVGIEAPDNIKVLRSELLSRDNKGNR